MNLAPFKKVTHVLFLGFSAAVAFAVSPAGQAFAHQYPKLGVVLKLLAVASAALAYHSPKQE